jgi:hypothetical protein
MSESIGQVAVRTNRCPRCRQWPGNPCVTKSGRRAGYAHAARCAPVLAGWHLGFGDMAQDVLSKGGDKAMKYAAAIVRMEAKR